MDRTLVLSLKRKYDGRNKENVSRVSLILAQRREGESCAAHSGIPRTGKPYDIMA